MCALVGVCLSPQLDAVRESITRQVYLYRLAHELCNCRRIHRHTIDSETTCSIKVTAPAALHNRVSDPGPTECSGSFLCKESVIESALLIFALWSVQVQVSGARYRQKQSS